LGFTAIVATFIAVILVEPASACGLQCKVERYQEWYMMMYNLHLSWLRAMEIVVSGVR
jgi:hypothetical protein